MNYEDAMQDFISDLLKDKNVMNAAIMHDIGTTDVVKKIKNLIQVRYYKNRNVRSISVNVMRLDLFIRFRKEYENKCNKQLSMFG